MIQETPHPPPSVSREDAQRFCKFFFEKTVEYFTLIENLDKDEAIKKSKEILKNTQVVTMEVNEPFLKVFVSALFPHKFSVKGNALFSYISSALEGASNYTLGIMKYFINQTNFNELQISDYLDYQE